MRIIGEGNRGERDVTPPIFRRVPRTLVALVAAVFALALVGCGGPVSEGQMDEEQALENAVDGTPEEPLLDEGADDATASDDAGDEDVAAAAETAPQLPIAQSLRPDLSHGPKPAEFQRYIVLHDTEGGGSPYDVIDGWESDGNFIASHFIVGRDGEVVQVVPMDEIAHHAGFGDAGHNDLYGTTDESRDDRRGTTPIGDWAPDYGMNSYSIGIEMIHRGESGEDYPEAQLEALDALIASIDDYYGTESQIIDHKAWRSYNSDTSPEFAGYLSNYQTTRTHDGA